jgi:DNA-binding Xre family transcriptional regulator
MVITSIASGIMFAGITVLCRRLGCNVSDLEENRAGSNNSAARRTLNGFSRARSEI